MPNVSNCVYSTQSFCLTFHPSPSTHCVLFPLSPTALNIYLAGSGIKMSSPNEFNSVSSAGGERVIIPRGETNVRPSANESHIRYTLAPQTNRISSRDKRRRRAAHFARAHHLEIIMPQSSNNIPMHMGARTREERLQGTGTNFDALETPSPNDLNDERNQPLWNWGRNFKLLVCANHCSEAQFHLIRTASFKHRNFKFVRKSKKFKIIFVKSSIL